MNKQTLSTTDKVMVGLGYGGLLGMSLAFGYFVTLSVQHRETQNKLRRHLATGETVRVPLDDKGNLMQISTPPTASTSSILHPMHPLGAIVDAIMSRREPNGPATAAASGGAAPAAAPAAAPSATSATA